MLFSKIFTSALMGLAVGQDAPRPPQAAAATVAPVLLERRSAGGDGDAGRPEFGPVEVAALREAVKVASRGMGGEPVAAEVAEAKTGLRGAGGGGTDLESDQHLETWRYDTFSMKASVRRTKVHFLAAGSASEYSTSTTMKSQSRTTRKMLYGEVRSAHREVSKTVEASMSAGASFPFGFMSLHAEASAGFSRAVTDGFENSSTKSDEYEDETVTSYETTTVSKYNARPDGEPDMVVYKEEYKIGNTVFQVAYLACDKADSERDGWDNEVVDIDVTAGVDYQWYTIQWGGEVSTWNGGAVVLEKLEVSSGLSSGGTPLALGADLDLYHEEYYHQWAWDNGSLISRVEGLQLVSASGEDANVDLLDPSIPHPSMIISDWGWTSENHIRNRYGHCVYIDLATLHLSSRGGYALTTVSCHSASSWDFIKVPLE